MQYEQDVPIALDRGIGQRCQPDRRRPRRIVVLIGKSAHFVKTRNEGRGTRGRAFRPRARTRTPPHFIARSSFVIGPGWSGWLNFRNTPGLSQSLRRTVGMKLTCSASERYVWLMFPTRTTSARTLMHSALDGVPFQSLPFRRLDFKECKIRRETFHSMKELTQCKYRLPSEGRVISTRDRFNASATYVQG